MTRYAIERLKQRAIQNIFAKEIDMNESLIGPIDRYFKIDSGRIVHVELGKDKVCYFIPSDSAQLAGNCLQLDKAYRIIAIANGTAAVREVRNSSELESVASGLMTDIERAFQR